MKEEYEVVPDNSTQNDIEKLTDGIEKDNDLKNDSLVRIKFVRNLKIFGSVLNFTIPFCITGTILTSGFYFMDAGLPFILDKEKRYKKYSYENNDGKITLIESYEGGIDHHINYGPTDFFVYSSWLENDTGYERTVRHYTEKELKDVELYNALKNKNFEYIYTNYKCDDEEIEYSNYVSEEEKNENEKIDGVLTCIDKHDYLLTVESAAKNNFSTFGVLGLTLFLGAYIAKIRNYKLKHKVLKHIDEYKISKNKIENNKFKALK